MKLDKRKSELGKKIFEIEFAKKTYQKKLIIVFTILNILLLCSILFLDIVCNNWTVATISILVFITCVVSCFFSVKFSINNLGMQIYQNYIVLGNNSSSEYLNLTDLKEFVIYYPILDKILKTQNKAIILYFNNNNYKKKFIFNIKTPAEIVDEKLNYAKSICTAKSFAEETKERKINSKKQCKKI